MTSSIFPEGIKGRHVLYGMILFFATIFAVNGVFLYYALKTHTGLDTPDAYRKGLAYNQRILAASEQEKLGWTGNVAVADGKLRLVLSDKAGLPISSLQIQAVLGRPSTDRFDRRLVLSEIAPGRYEVSVGALDAGTWMLGVEALRQTSNREQVVYRMRKRLWLKP
ncbi:MAG: FixH family protein [Hyphomicrobiaceae bacterium]|nr:FixH family protein [Hyphomicrobiaceae bacterium]